MVKKIYLYTVGLFTLFVAITIAGGVWHYKHNIYKIKSIVSTYQYNFIINESAYDKLELIKRMLDRYYNILFQNEIKKKQTLLQNDLEKLNSILQTLQRLHFNNYKAFLFKYIFSVYNKNDIDISQNGKIIIAKQFTKIGKNFTSACDPFKNYGQCIVEKNNKVYIVQYSPSYNLILESDFKKSEINKKALINNILEVVKSIPNIIIYHNGKKISGNFNNKSFYIFEKFKPANIFIGIGIKYKNINSLSNAINKQIFQKIKPFLFSFMLVYLIIILILYIGLFIIFKYKILFIEKVLDEYNKKAHFDKLTNLYNRHGFENVFDKSICRYFLIIDLDNFKYINDTFGHNTGDKVLKYFSTLLKHYFNNSVLARWGGDEFLVCTNKSKEEIKKSIEKISQHLFNYQHYFDHQLTKKLGISAGACDNKEMDFQKKFNNADLALYKVKKTGKGHILFFDELDYVKIEKDDIRK